MPEPIRHLLPLGRENLWSNLLAVLAELDPGATSTALGVNPLREPITVEREVESPHGDRVDLLVREGDRLRAVVEVKLLSGLGTEQLTRYRASFPGADRYVLVCLRGLPVHVRPAAGWDTVYWEDLLAGFGRSEDPWVRQTATAWAAHLRDAVPVVGSLTRWNDLCIGEDFVIALRARMSWVYHNLHPQRPIRHDLIGSSAGVSWVVRMNVPAKAPGYLVRVKAEERLPVRRYPKHLSASAPRPLGPSVKVCLVQTGVRTSKEFSWSYLHDMWPLMAEARDDWVTAAARPRAVHDRYGHDLIVGRGAPKHLGIGFGEAEAKRSGECMFGARVQLAPDVRLAELVRELRNLGSLMLKMAAAEPPADIAALRVL